MDVEHEGHFRTRSPQEATVGLADCVTIIAIVGGEHAIAVAIGQCGLREGIKIIAVDVGVISVAVLVVGARAYCGVCIITVIPGQ